MKRFLSWLIMIPFALVVIVFSAVNRELVMLDLWPFPYEISVPIFTLVLAVFIFGFLWGGAVAWVSAGDSRKRSRNNMWRAEKAERELRQLSNRLQDRERELMQAKAAENESQNLPVKTTGA